MRQLFVLSAGILCLLQPALRINAQDRESVAALAARQATDDEIRRLRGDVQNLEAANANLQKRINQLVEELRQVREDNSRANASVASRDDLSRLAKDVRNELRELDSKRVADNARVLEALEKLSKTSAPAPVLSNSSRHDSSPPEKSKPDRTPATEKGYWYEIKKGDTFAEIIQACRKQGVNVTSTQVKEANPDINPNKIRVGQKLWIPDPSAK